MFLRNRQYHYTQSVKLIVAAIVAGLLIALVFHDIAHADTQTVPYRINFQGRLADASGSTLPAGTYNMKFRIYDAETGGSLLWTGQRSVYDGTGTIVSSGGLFSVQLGRISNMPADMFANPDLYFEIELPTPATIQCATVGCESYTEGPMSPRRRMLSSPYSFNADQLDGIDSTAFSQLATDNNWTGNSNIFGGNIFGVTSATSASVSSPIISLSTTNSSVTLNGANIVISGTSLTNSATTTLFQNASDSTSAFTIARAGSGGELFVADTTNSRIYIGNPTPDASTALLVVDNSSAANDPTGTNGAMYYNTSTNKFRCYEDSKWINCVGTRQIRSFLDTSSDAAADNNTTNYWDLSTQNNNSYPNLTPSSAQRAVLGTVSFETQSATTADRSIVARVERSVGSLAACGSGTPVGTILSTFTTNTGEQASNTMIFLDEPSTTSTVYYTLCADTATSSAGSMTINRIRFTLEEATNSID